MAIYGVALISLIARAARVRCRIPSDMHVTIPPIFHYSSLTQ